jgi:hypothetical protein
MTIQLYRNRMLFTSKWNRLFLDAGTFHCKMAPALVTIQSHQNCLLFVSRWIFSDTGAFVCERRHRHQWQFSCIEIVCYLLVDETEYSHMQASSVVVHQQMAPASVTIHSHQNHMLLTSGRNRIFLDAGAFCCKMAPASVIIQLNQNHMLFTSGCNRIFLVAGTFDRCSLSTGTRVGDKSVTSKSHSIY